ncbi:MAG: hypothetical protein IAF38_20580 [Bacteroidia bacterium]|nr:hypothetical protein [Bacteroidia bacterium]
MNPDLVDFVVKRTHLKAGEIKPELRLAEDIGFYGMDAVSFFEEFFAEFKIKNCEDFDFDMHIDRGPDFALQPIKWLKNIVVKSRRRYLRPDVSIGHLEKVQEKGEWFNER